MAPTATFAAPTSSFAGFPFTLSISDPEDPSAADEAAGFTYAFDCGDGSGYGAFGASASTSCATDDTGTRSIGAKIRDQDGGVSEYLAEVELVVTVESLCDLTREYSSKPRLSATSWPMGPWGRIGAR